MNPAAAFPPQSPQVPTGMAGGIPAGIPGGMPMMATNRGGLPQIVGVPQPLGMAQPGNLVTNQMLLYPGAGASMFPFSFRTNTLSTPKIHDGWTGSSEDLASEILDTIIL